MANEKRLIDAMQTVTKMSGRITPLLQMGANPVQVYNEALQVIAESPTVDTVPVVHGRWEFYCKDYSKCSRCGFGRNIKSQFGWHYCPNCGAKMDGDGNG